MLPHSGFAALLASAAAALAACGGGGGSPQAVAKEWITSDDPSKCGLLAPETLAQVTGRRGEAARRFCEANVRRSAEPADVRVIETEVRRGRALVELVADQREERLLLDKRDGRWLITDFPE